MSKKNNFAFAIGCLALLVAVSIFPLSVSAQVGPAIDPLQADCVILGYDNLEDCKSAQDECKTLGIDLSQCTADTILAKKQSQGTPRTVETTLGKTLDWGTIGLIIVAVVAIVAVAIVALVIKRPVAPK